MVAMTPCNCGTLGGLYVLVGSFSYPSPGRMFEPSCYGRLLCHEAGLTYCPLLALPGLCLMPDLQSRQPAPEASSDRHRWRWPCLPRFRLLQTPCFCGMLGGRYVLVGALTSFLHRMIVIDLPDFTLDLTVLQYSSLVLACTSLP